MTDVPTPRQTAYIEEDEVRQRVNDIALTLDIEQPYVMVGECTKYFVLDRRKWRNWLEAVTKVAGQHGPIHPVETVGQQALDVFR